MNVQGSNIGTNRRVNQGIYHRTSHPGAIVELRGATRATTTRPYRQHSGFCVVRRMQMDADLTLEKAKKMARQQKPSHIRITAASGQNQKVTYRYRKSKEEQLT